MPRTPSELFLVSILISVNKIIRNSENLSYQNFTRDEKIFGFLTRELQEIGESVNKLLKDALLPSNEREKWREVAAFRNIVVHEYFGVHPAILFEVIIKDVPVLKEDIMVIVQKLKDKTFFLQALSDTKKVYTALERYDTVSYIEEIEKIFNM